MTAIDRFFLKLFLLPQRLYAKQGVDILHLRAILTAKLTMDNRRVTSLMAQRQKKTQKHSEVNNSNTKTLIFSFLMGLMLLFSFAVGHETLTRLTMFSTMFIFMLCMTLITDFTNVLIDTRDNLILLPKPVSDKTFLMAKLLHIGIRLIVTVLPLAIPTFVVYIATLGIAVILPFLLICILMTIFSVFLINALYLLILKLTTPDKFKSIITAIQIVFVVFVFASYQLFPRLMTSDTMRNTNLNDIFWIRFYPPYWFSEACLFLSGKLTNQQAVIGLALAVVVPIVSIWAVVRFLAPVFTQKLTLISGGVEEKNTKTASSGIKRLKLKELFCSILARGGAEKAGFLFSWDMMARSKDFRMKVLPQFGYVAVLGVIFYLQKHTPLSLVLIITYFSSSILTNALLQIPYSDKFKSAWLFHVTPITAPGKIIGGSVKAVLAMFYLPLAVMLLVLGLFMLGPAEGLSIAFGILNVLTIAIFEAYLNFKHLPFSKQVDGAAAGGGFVRMLLNLLPIAVLGILHAFLHDKTWAIALLTAISALTSWLLFSEISKRKWSGMKV